MDIFLQKAVFACKYVASALQGGRTLWILQAEDVPHIFYYRSWRWCDFYPQILYVCLLFIFTDKINYFTLLFLPQCRSQKTLRKPNEEEVLAFSGHPLGGAAAGSEVTKTEVLLKFLNSAVNSTYSIKLKFQAFS